MTICLDSVVGSGVVPSAGTSSIGPADSSVAKAWATFAGSSWRPRARSPGTSSPGSNWARIPRPIAPGPGRKAQPCTRYRSVVDRYLAAKADQIRPTTYEATDRYLRQYFGGLRNMPIGTIKRAEIAARLEEITTTHGRVAAARARAHLSSLFTWAIREGFLDSNPVVGTNDPARASRRAIASWMIPNCARCGTPAMATIAMARSSGF